MQQTGLLAEGVRLQSALPLHPMQADKTKYELKGIFAISSLHELQYLIRIWNCMTANS